MQIKQDNRLISFLQTFGIILVVIGHSLVAPFENLVPEFIRHWIYNFHMPLFMFISGYLFKYSLKQSVTQINLPSFFKHKAIRLLIPYLCFTLLAWIPKHFLSDYAMRPIGISPYDIVYSLLYPWQNPIIFQWFLPTLFLMFAIVIPLLKYTGKSIALLAPLAISAIILSLNIQITDFLNITGVVNYLIWWILGYYFCMGEIKVLNLLKLDNPIVTISLFIATIGTVYIPDNHFVKIIIALIGILFSISLALQYEKRQLIFLNHLNGYSFSIFLLSWFPQTFIRICLCQILGLPWYYFFILGALFGIYVPYIIARFARKYYGNNKVVKIIIGL